MSEESQIDPDTLRAYRETEFRVTGDAAITLRIGQACAKLARLQLANRVDCSTFITACNPFSIQLSDAENAERQAALAEDLQKTKPDILRRRGATPFQQVARRAKLLGAWPDLGSRQVVGRQLEQNAIVWSGADALSQLVLPR